MCSTALHANVSTLHVAWQMDTLRARLRFLEERNKQLELELQDHGKQVNTISKTTIPKLTGNIDTLMKVSTRFVRCPFADPPPLDNDNERAVGTVGRQEIAEHVNIEER